MVGPFLFASFDQDRPVLEHQPAELVLILLSVFVHDQHSQSKPTQFISHDQSWQGQSHDDHLGGIPGIPQLELLGRGTRQLVHDMQLPDEEGELVCIVSRDFGGIWMEESQRLEVEVLIEGEEVSMNEGCFWRGSVVVSMTAVGGKEVEFEDWVLVGLLDGVPLQQFNQLGLMGQQDIVVVLYEVPVLLVQAQGQTNLFPPILVVHLVESPAYKHPYPRRATESKRAKLSYFWNSAVCPSPFHTPWNFSLRSSRSKG